MPGMRLSLIDDVDGGVVRQIELVVPPVRRRQRDDLQQRRRLLLDAEALGFDLVGQPRFGQADAILHLDVVEVGIGADRERHRERIAAVAAAGRLHVERFVDADHLRLDRLRNGGLDHFGAGAGVGALHLDLRRHDVGKLRDRNLAERDRAGQRDDNRDDGSQPRPRDENVGDHRLALAGSRLHPLVRIMRYAPGLASVALTTCPGRMRWMPSVTTRSPALSPLRSTMLVPRGPPISTRRTCTLFSLSTTSTKAPD